MMHSYISYSFLRVFIVLTATIAGTLVTSTALAHNDRPAAAFDVEFSNCIESIGVNLLPTEKVRLLVP